MTILSILPTLIMPTTITLLSRDSKSTLHTNQLCKQLLDEYTQRYPNEKSLFRVVVKPRFPFSQRATAWKSGSQILDGKMQNVDIFVDEIAFGRRSHSAKAYVAKENRGIYLLLPMFSMSISGFTRTGRRQVFEYPLHDARVYADGGIAARDSRSGIREVRPNWERLATL